MSCLRLLFFWCLLCRLLFFLPLDWTEETHLGTDSVCFPCASAWSFVAVSRLLSAIDCCSGQKNPSHFIWEQHQGNEWPGTKIVCLHVCFIAVQKHRNNSFVLIVVASVPLFQKLPLLTFLLVRELVSVPVKPWNCGEQASVRISGLNGRTVTGSDKSLCVIQRLVQCNQGPSHSCYFSKSLAPCNSVKELHPENWSLAFLTDFGPRFVHCWFSIGYFHILFSHGQSRAVCLLEDGRLHGSSFVFPVLSCFAWGNFLALRSLLWNFTLVIALYCWILVPFVQTRGVDGFGVYTVLRLFWDGGVL